MQATGWNQIVAAHLQEATIVLPVLADEHRVHRRLHVVVDAARAGPAEEGKGPVVGVEHHLLRLARIGPHEHHADVAKPDVGNLHDHRHAGEQDDLVAPVELVSFARREEKRHVGLAHGRTARLVPALGVAPDRVVAALVAERPQFLIDADQRQPLALLLGAVAVQQSVELRLPRPDLRLRLTLALVSELRRARTQHFPNHLPRDPQVAANLLDRLSLNQRQPTYLRNRLQDQHPKKCLR